jgi:hypothetical protein
MVKAVAMINEAKALKSGVVVDLHPDRPAYRGFQGSMGPVSLESDPTFAEVEAVGGTVVKNDEPHTILDNMFLVSGKIPRVTPYEVGFKRGLRFNDRTRIWESDELIMDERFLMCNVKGKTPKPWSRCGSTLTTSKGKASLHSPGAVMRESSTWQNMPWNSAALLHCMLWLGAIIWSGRMRHSSSRRWQISRT